MHLKVFVYKYNKYCIMCIFIFNKNRREINFVKYST